MTKKPSAPKSFGDLLLEHEKIMQQFVAHGLQWGDILFLTYGYLMVHCPEAREEYTDGGNPELHYGPKKES